MIRIFIAVNLTKISFVKIVFHLHNLFSFFLHIYYNIFFIIFQISYKNQQKENWCFKWDLNPHAFATVFETVMSTIPSSKHFIPLGQGRPHIAFPYGSICSTKSRFLCLQFLLYMPIDKLFSVFILLIVMGDE